MLKIRKAAEEEYEEVVEFYYDLIDALAETEYKPGWKKDIYPTREFLEEAIKKQELYLGRKDGKILSCMILNHSCHENYKKISWRIQAEEQEVLVIHALGVHPAFSGQGIAKQMVQKAIKIAEKAGTVAWSVSTVSIWLFLGARSILAIGESGNFPCAIKVTAEYFPKRDRAFATSLFNAGAQLGALLAPFTIPVIASNLGWEMSFMIIGALGFIWMGFWIKMYDIPSRHSKVNKKELEYIEQDKQIESKQDDGKEDNEKHISILKCFTFRQTWAVIFGRLLPDGVWWFFLFWAPAYVKDVHGYSSDSTMGMLLIFTLYLISMLSILGGYLPTVFINRLGMNPFAGRMRAMLIFSLFPLLGLMAQPLGDISCWYPIIIIGIIGAAHQSWSANTYTVVSDMFPKSAVATVTGIGGMAGGIGCFILNQGSGMLFTYAKESNMTFMGYEGINAGYMIVFVIASLAYLFSWIMIRILVPKYKIIKI